MNSLKLLAGSVVLLLSTLAILITSCNDESTSSYMYTSENTSKDINTSVTLRSISLGDTNNYDIRVSNPYSPSAYVTQMCYTKTIDDFNNTYNPCFSCHTINKIPNYIMGDADLQESYAFPEPALKNPFINNFIDFSSRVSEISDEEIMEYVKQSNYFDKNKNIILAQQLQELSDLWDSDGDGVWHGYIPDCYYNFNKKGFDIKPDGEASGWVAFSYMPFLGTFWPTNGSTDDVLIRLDESMMKATKDGDFNTTIYSINLSIVEALIKQKDIPLDSSIDEELLNVDLNKNGILDIASSVTYKWAPNDGVYMSYVGYAKVLLDEGKLHLAAGLYPENTEFLHSVRYIKSNKDGEIALSPRMKELRYAKKHIWLTYANLQNKGMATIQEKSINPDRLETFRGTMEQGLGNNMGWSYQGFIEDKNGNLRPQSYEETLNCMGCHSGIGATTDSTFAFPRKLNDSFQNGWYHTTQKDLKNTPELRYSDGTYELSHYLELNPYGDEFRENSEVYDKFHLDNGDLNQSMIRKLHDDVTLLLYPSHKRALDLNKAYKALVEQQKFYNGKAGHIKPMQNVHKEVKEAQSTKNNKYVIK
ncbi:MAG: hypothetical protein Q9M34_11555 [Sulfurimonas sp.]|nr:hypothetical protein [Sulfurimonas sp.]